jgi:hypothetical protein
MKTWITILICSLSVSLLHASNLLVIRDLYEHAAINEDKAKQLLKLTENANETNAVLLGYQGAGYMTLANHSMLPTTKLAYFQKGKKILEMALKTAPNNLELHYIRLTIQLNIPSFLGYSNQIKLDKKILLQHIKTNPLSATFDLEKRIIAFLLSSKQCTKEELSMHNKHE